MSYVKMIDLLRRGEKFHNDLAAYYESLKESARREDVKMMLEYIKRHETFLAQTLKAYEAEAPSKVLDTWFQYEPEASLMDAINSVAIDPDMTPDDVIELAVKLDECLISLYKQMKEFSPPAEVLEAVDKLLEIEEEQRNKMVHGLQGGQ